MSKEPLSPISDNMNKKESPPKLSKNSIMSNWLSKSSKPKASSGENQNKPTDTTSNKSSSKTSKPYDDDDFEIIGTVKSKVAKNDKKSSSKRIESDDEESNDAVKKTKTPTKEVKKTTDSKAKSSTTGKSSKKIDYSDESDEEVPVKKSKLSTQETKKTSDSKSKSTSKSSKKIDDDESDEEVPVKKSKTAAKETKKSTESSSKAKSTTKKKHDDFDEDDDLEVAGKKGNKSLNKSSTEKKGGNKFYAAYMRREGPKNPGSKPVPIGKKGCFNGLKFLLTGVLESLNRDECKSIVEKYGGTCISGVSKKLDYLIVGDEAGQAKIEKADELHIKKISEDEFLQLICTKSGITNPTYENDQTQCEDEQMNIDDVVKSSPEDKKKASVNSGKKPNLKALDESFDLENLNLESELKLKKGPTPKKLNSPLSKETVTPKVEIKSELKSPKKEATKETTAQPKVEIKSELKSPKKEANKILSSTAPTMEKKPLVSSQSISSSDVQSELWVEKHKPKQMNRIIGQGGDKSNATKLFNWLKNWQVYHGPDSKSVKKTWNDQEKGTCFKAALLSGPPGIGKTTTATLVCKEAGFTFIELNASDSRSKKLLDKVLGESSDSCSMDSYLVGKHKATSLNQDKHCIIMDEVDGMAGNEDRGGILELINTIKASKIPIICICNDRQHVKIRSLANHCFDLRFYKPGVAQVRAALLSICFKEKIQASQDVLDQIIVGCNYDIRQCLNNLSMWSSNNKNLVSNQSTKSDIEKAMKDIRMNPFEACRQVFHCEPNGQNKKSMIDKMDLFFCDYSLMPLLVHENYLSVKPVDLKGNTKIQRDYSHLLKTYASIESMCHSDKISRLLRTNNNWSLLPTQGIFATVVPGESLRGSMGMSAFPGWFGKNSKMNRVDRILQELQKHMRIKISANKIGVGMDYLSVLKVMLTKPLIKRGADGIQDVLNIMNEYNLTRDDFDTILELSTWPGQKDLQSMIDSKVKASFTRAYNKESHKNPFSIVNIKKLKGSKVNEETVDGEGVDGEDDSSEDEENDDISKDAMIKIKKTASKSSTGAKASASVKRNITDNSDTVTSKPASKKKKT